MKFLVALALVIVSLLIALRVARSFADGPIGPIPGGPLRSGSLIADVDVDWVAVTHGKIEQQLTVPLLVEFQLLEPLGSRATGIMISDGSLYIPCDLGFSWARFSGPKRWVLNLVHLVKTWHKEALEDGRAVLRIAGKRYERQAVRVTDPKRLKELRGQFEGLVQNWVSVGEWGAVPTKGPRDIWFFRLDPRSSP
jgi:hypothetical protein